ncbi:hypothetical protein RA307_29055 [Xanthobacteraceae bacterium Astr-EGSB]|uniref:hypothetical protein n=1 Tax=Astrobacterium formosum TaxID=3069710 RepID=UPI0027B1ED44|nr:hypothetical protein [Xanthobacteraceae bacterium Astr-EGSB]
MSDVFTEALNAPAGRLAEVLIKKLKRSDQGPEMPPDMRARLDKLTDAEGRFGTLARVRLAAELSLLFERAPQWSAEKIVPLFNWSCPDASLMWSARRYSNYIGSPKLFGLMKEPFLALFGRTDVSEEDRETYADWLTAIVLANQAEDAGYPLTPAEARSALRQGGPGSLNDVGHRLALYMQKAKPEDKLAAWRNVVGPVFASIWPLDIELQTPATTFKLVQILRASGAAFPAAAETIIPFIRAEDPRRHTSVYSIADADDVLYSTSPENMLDLLAAVVGDAPLHGVYNLGKALDRIRRHAPHLAESKKFQKLVTAASIH